MGPAPCTCPLLLTSHAKRSPTLSSRPSAWGSWPGCPHPEAPAVPGKSSALCWAPRGLLPVAGLSTPGPGDLTHTPAGRLLCSVHQASTCWVTGPKRCLAAARCLQEPWRTGGLGLCTHSGPARPGRPRQLRPSQSGSGDLQCEVLRSSGRSTVPMGPRCSRTLHVQSRLGSLRDCTLSRNIPALGPTCWLTPSKSCLKRPLPSEL